MSKIFQWRENVPLALPVIIGQLGHIVTSVADSIMVGQLGVISLAAVSLAGSITSVPLVFGIGVAYGLTPLVARAYGQKRWGKAYRLLKNSTLVNLLTSTIMFLFAWLLFLLVQKTNQSIEVIQESRVYLILIMVSYIPFMLFLSGKQYLEGMGDTKTPMRISLIGNLLNVLLNGVLIFGLFSFPVLGILGAGIATIIARIIMAIHVWYFVLEKRNNYKIVQDNVIISIRAIRSLLKLGLPSGLQYVFEVSAFAASAWIIGTYGPSQLAAHQIAINLASISYMAATGLGAAGTVRMGQLLGAKRGGEALNAGKSLFSLTIAFMIFTGILFFTLRNILPSFYTTDSDVISAAASLLIVATIFQVSDGLQATALGVLRGMQDVKTPTVISFVSYYVIALPLEWLLGTYFGWGAIGVWVALAIGLTLSATLLISRFYNQIGIVALKNT
jgi:MATE family multidrug resistance protein|tara:strand:+ start:5110 stop:6444 length:1335 start_codon:yes stop_codon:yes gene_type:complete